MNESESRWQAVLARFGSPARPRPSAAEPLWLGRSGWAHVATWLPPSASVVVLSAKRSPLDWWLEAGSVPAHFGLVYAPHAADPRVLPVVGAALPRRATVVFVGDLDPPAIVQYLELRRTAPFRQRLRFGGVDSGWLEAVQGKLRAPVDLDRLCIPLSEEERRLLSLLEQAFPVQKLVGARAAAILRSGFKVELEGVTNPHLLGGKRDSWAFALLRRAAARGRAL